MDKEIIMSSIGQKKKIVFPKYSKYAFILSAVILVSFIIVKILETCKIYVCMFCVGTEDILMFSRVAFSILFITAASVLFYKNNKHKILVVVITIAVLFLCLPYLFLYSLKGLQNKYYEFTSPDKKHTIVAQQNSSFNLLWTSGGIYEKTSFCTMREVGRYTSKGSSPFAPTDSSYQSFYFVWNEDNCELYYNDGRGGGINSVIKIDYSK